jgi:aryl sulfotransferase
VAEAQIAWPKKTREIQNPMWDSSRWNAVKFRDGDIFIDSYGKSGSTLMRQIVAQLIYGGHPDRFGPEIAARLEIVGLPLEAMLARVEANKDRRIFDSHTPLDALPFDPKVKYIYVARDPRDVVWSAHNHRTNYLPDVVKDAPGWEPDIRAYYHHWLEHDDGLGLWLESFWGHVKAWWDVRHLPNVLLVHFSNLKADLPSEIRRIAAFLDIRVDEATMPAILDHCSVDYMRTATSKIAFIKSAFREGADSFFFYKGSNGRWRDVLSAEEIARCDEVAVDKLGPDCAHWLKTGELTGGEANGAI